MGSFFLTKREIRLREKFCHKILRGVDFVFQMKEVVEVWWSFKKKKLKFGETKNNEYGFASSI